MSELLCTGVSVYYTYRVNFILTDSNFKNKNLKHSILQSIIFKQVYIIYNHYFTTIFHNSKLQISIMRSFKMHNYYTAHYTEELDQSMFTYKQMIAKKIICI